MKKTLSLALGLLATSVGSAAELDDVLSCNFETTGGLDNIKAVQSARMSGSMTMGPMVAPFTIEFLEPDNVRMEFELQGMTAVQGFDGETGWQIMPFLGKTTAEEMTPDELKSIKEMAEWEGPLVDWEDKGHKVVLAGTEDVEGTEAYVLELTRVSGDEMTMFLDTEYCLPFMMKGSREVQGNEFVFTSTIGDYKEVGDIVMAHSIIQSIGEGAMAMEQAITIESVEMNLEDITEDRFSMPPAPEPEVAEE